MTHQSRPSRRRLLVRAVQEARFTIEDIAEDAGITSAALRRYRAGSRRVPERVLTEMLPDAFRGHARKLIALAAELESTLTKED